MGKYYFLFVYQYDSWHAEFGDASRSVVESERLEYRTHHKAKHLRIETFDKSATAQDVFDRVASLNSVAA